MAQKDPHDWAISARGFNTDSANKLLVLMDGRSVYTPLFSGVFWDVQDYLLEDIDRIEVISGPGGTLWGANAVNGVINITSKSAKDTQGTYWETSGGSRFQESLAIRNGGTLAPDVYYRVYGKYFDKGDEVFPDGSDASDSWSHRQGGVPCRRPSRFIRKLHFPRRSIRHEGLYRLRWNGRGGWWKLTGTLDEDFFSG